MGSERKDRKRKRSQGKETSKNVEQENMATRKKLMHRTKSRKG